MNNKKRVKDRITEELIQKRVHEILLERKAELVRRQVDIIAQERVEKYIRGRLDLDVLSTL